MKKLLEIEWLKLKHYGAFKILAAFFLVGVVLTNYIVFSVNKNVVSKVSAAGMMGSYNPYDFSNTWQTTSYVTGFLLILPAMLIIILITNEYGYKTSRQNIIDGWSRQQFISVKLFLAFIIAAVSTVLVMLTAIGFGFGSGSSFGLDSISHVGYFFLKALSYNVIAVFVSVLVRKTGFAIGLYFIYLGAENLISQLLDFWSMKIKVDTNYDLGSLGDYLPMNSADGLLTFPDNMLKSMASAALPTNYTWLVLSLAIGYIILFTWLSVKRFVKADL